MTRRKSKVTGIVSAVALVMLLAGITGAGVWLVKSCQSKSETFGVKIDGTLYVKNADDLVFDNTTTIAVTNPSPEGYSVKIYPQAAKDDFTFTIGGEAYKWSETQATEFTDGFNMTATENECVISYTNLATVISKVLGHDHGDVTVPGAPAGDLFVLRISSGDKTISIGFTLADLRGNVGITEIKLDTGGVFFEVKK